MSKKIKIFLVGCVLMVMCCMGITVGASEDAKAKVVAHNLTITDAGINVNFYVDIQGDVTVTLNDTEVEVPETKEKIVIDAKAYDCYKFTQPVVAKEMDKNVSLVIKSGDDAIVEDNYCVNAYAASVINEQYNNFKYEELVKAMTYYGDFAEVYLNYDAEQAAEAEAFLQQFDETAEAELTGDAYKIAKGESVEGIEATGIQLNLVSEVSIRLNFKVTDEKALDYEFTAGGKNLGKLKKGNYNGNEYYYVDIENIGADALDKAYEIIVDGTTILSNCSALSYARAVLNSGTASDKLVNLAKALYLYNKKAETYVASQATAVFDIFYGSEGFSATPGSKTAIYYTADDDVTRESTGNTEITKLSDLNGKNIKGCTVWMETAYPVSGTEEISGPYVIRRYENNTGSLLNVSGTATFTAKLDANTGDFAVKYPGVSAYEFTIGEAVKNEVAVSGTLNVTGSTKTGVITVPDGNTATINAEGLTEDAAVVFANQKGVNLSGNGDASAISLLDDGMGHFDVVKHENNVRMASVICVCGKDVTGKTSHACPWTENVDNIAKVYDIKWEPWDESYSQQKWKLQILPSVSGSYYLVNDMEYTAHATTLNSDIEVNIDLAGHKVIQANTGYRIFNVDGGELNIADSSNGGELQCSVDSFGGVIWLQKGEVNVFGGTLKTNVETASNTGVILEQRAGVFNMYDGEISPGKIANAVITKVGMNIYGGTIKGDVMIYDANAIINISGSAQVGVKDGNDNAYGIYGNVNAKNARLVCSDVTGTDTIVLKDRESVALSGTGEASAFKLLEDGLGHFGVVNYDDGEKQNAVKFASIICVCGKSVNEHTKSCAWTQANGGLTAVYDIPWEPWDESYSQQEWELQILPSVSGSYYLVNDMEYTAHTTTLNSGIKVNIDLAGHTVTQNNTGCRVFTMKGGTLNITDSSQANTGKIICNVASSVYGRVIQTNTEDTSTVNLYNGTLSSIGGSAAGEVIYHSVGTVNVYGGKISQTSNVDGIVIANSSIMNVTGGEIVGEVQLNNVDAKLNISDSAKVGVSDGTDKEYGIYAPATLTTAPSVECTDVAAVDGGKNIVLKDERFVALSGTGDASAFEISENLHNQVAVIDNKLDFEARMCTCGKVGEHTQVGNCGVPDGKWETWNTAKGTIDTYVLLPRETGNYYLTEDMSLNLFSDIGNATQKSEAINLDMAGHTATLQAGATNGFAMFRLDKSSSLNIADSVGGGKLVSLYEGTVYGGIIYLWKDNPTVNVYNVALEATKGTTSGYGLVVHRNNGIGKFSMYGGSITGKTGYTSIMSGGNNAKTGITLNAVNVDGEVVTQ